VKYKASKLKNYQKGTGGGGPPPTSLQETEKRLISLMGMESVIGHLSVIDPAEVCSILNLLITNCKGLCPQCKKLVQDFEPREG